MEKYVNTPNQKENDKHPEINPEATEIYNLTENSKSLLKNSSSEKTQKESLMISEIKLMNRGNSS